MREREERGEVKVGLGKDLKSILEFFTSPGRGQVARVATRYLRRWPEVEDGPNSRVPHASERDRREAASERGRERRGEGGEVGCCCCCGPRGEGGMSPLLFS